MNRSVLLILFLIFSEQIFSQTKFAWCPGEQIISPMNGFLEGKQIDLIIYDARDAENYIVTCNGRLIKNNLIRLIRETYTSPDINVAGEDPSAEPEENKVTIKIGILDYHVFALGAQHKMQSGQGHSGSVDFSEDRWKAVSRYLVEIIDFTEGRWKAVTKEISKSVVWSRTEKFEVAQDSLKTVFRAANCNLLIFIDDTFVQ